MPEETGPVDLGNVGIGLGQTIAEAAEAAEALKDQLVENPRDFFNFVVQLVEDQQRTIGFLQGRVASLEGQFPSHQHSHGQIVIPLLSNTRSPHSWQSELRAAGPSWLGAAQRAIGGKG